MEAIYTPMTPFATMQLSAEIGEMTVSRGVQLDGTPVNAGTEFLAGQPVLYVSFDYSDMSNGILWRHIWLRNGNLVGGQTRLWEWNSSGRTYFFLSPPGGFQPGRYELQLLMDEKVITTTSFRVIEQ
jgi:hypothetical protein